MLGVMDTILGLDGHSDHPIHRKNKKYSEDMARLSSEVQVAVRVM